jgi:hypothetical protein
VTIVFAATGRLAFGDDSVMAVMMRTALDHAELEQVSHWKPSTAGELIFNYWD